MVVSKDSLQLVTISRDSPLLVENLEYLSDLERVLARLCDDLTHSLDDLGHAILVLDIATGHAILRI